MNSYTGTPVNTVWFSVVMAALFGALTFPGAQATNAMFAVSIAALYVAYVIPIVARFVFENDFKPGPFNLGVFVGPLPLFSPALGVGANIISAEFTHWFHRSGVHGVHDHHFHVPHITWCECYFYELHRSRPGRRAPALTCMVLLPRVWGRALVYWIGNTRKLGRMQLQWIERR